MILQPGEKQALSLQGKFLLARRIQGRIVISDPAIQMSETDIKQSDVIELPDSRIIYVKNLSEEVADIELQSSTVRIISNDGGAVSISGGTIDNITNGITVTAEATVNDGSITSLSPNVNSQASDIVIPSGQTAVIVPANPTAERRVVIIQNISAAVVPVRVGLAPTASAGAMLNGGIDAVASLEFDTTGQLSAYNAGATDATICVMWGQR